MDERELVRQMVDKAIADALQSREYTRRFDSEDRWANLMAYVNDLEAKIKAEHNPSEEIILHASLMLEQFPDYPALDQETEHVQCVHKLLRTVLAGLRKEMIERIVAEREGGRKNASGGQGG